MKRNLRRLTNATTAYIWAKFAWQVIGIVLLTVALTMVFMFFGTLESFR